MQKEKLRDFFERTSGWSLTPPHTTFKADARLSEHCNIYTLQIPFFVINGYRPAPLVDILIYKGVRSSQKEEFVCDFGSRY